MTQLNKKSSKFHFCNGNLWHGVTIAIIVAALMMINTPNALSAPPSSEMYTFLERFHGHTCPGSLMGLRLGLAAKNTLQGNGKLKANCFLLACPVDGIQVGAGTTYGNKSLEVEDRNELYIILTEIKSGRQVDARLTDHAMEMGKNYRELSNKARSHANGSPEQLRFKNEMNDILGWFRTAPDSEIVIVRSIK